jgi:fucose 4-O-acetylase-like acetyltransferase
MEHKNLTVSTARGLAILLVVYGHILQRSMMVQGQDFFLNPVFKLIYTFHMPLFFFISGYLIAFTLSRRNIADALKMRFKSLFIPFLSWGVLGILTNEVLNIIDGRNLAILGFPENWVQQLLLCPFVWFLFTLFVLSSLLLLSIYLEKRMGGISFILVYFLILIIPFNEYFYLYYIKWFYLFYMAGYFINRWNVKITGTPLTTVIGFSVSLVLFVVLNCGGTEMIIFMLIKCIFPQTFMGF